MSAPTGMGPWNQVLTGPDGDYRYWIDEATGLTHGAGPVPASMRVDVRHDLSEFPVPAPPLWVATGPVPPSAGAL